MKRYVSNSHDETGKACVMGARQGEIAPCTDAVSPTVVRIQVKLRTMECAVFFILPGRETSTEATSMPGAGISDNAATRLQAIMDSKGSFAYGGYPALDELSQQQARARDRAKQQAFLHRIQELTGEPGDVSPDSSLITLSTGISHRALAFALVYSSQTR
jgi:hypothetical protein